MKEMKLLKNVLLGSILIFSGFNANAKPSITTSGSTTVLPIVQRAAEVFMDKYPEINISVRGGGSGVGISQIIEGKVNIANSSRPIQTKELKSAREKGINPTTNVIANDGIVIIVHPSNPIKELTIATLKDIYAGTITNWKKLGGPDKPIVVVSRDVASGTFEVFNGKVMTGAKVKEDAIMLASNNAVATTIDATPGAIGYVGLGFLSDKVKALIIEGVTPSDETVKDGTYKLSRQLFMYTNGTPKGVVKEFIDFVLSEEGQKIVKETGYVTIN
ncbi:MAG: PstS family phosphate ABC transporter substrate-binding protein [bacterium]|nr:PstS family phosphate ABC transporter substrate-binding protein [bacterium]